MSVDYILHLVLILLLICLMKFTPTSILSYITTWWTGSVLYALILNEITIPAAANPWTFSVVTTTFILLVPGILGHSTELQGHSVVTSNRVIGLCNMLNIWSVVLGSLLIGGSETYYLKLNEPLAVFIVEALVFGKQNLTIQHAKNGMISIVLLIIFHFTSVYVTPGNGNPANYLSHSTIIAVISIVSVAIKVVLGAKRDGSDDKVSIGDHTLFLFRSSFGLKCILSFTTVALIIDRDVLTNMSTVLPALIMIAITQNLYNYASFVVNLKNLAGEYVNGKIIKRTLVLIALTLRAVQSSATVPYVTDPATLSDVRISLTDVKTSPEEINNSADNTKYVPQERIVIFGAIGRHNFGDLLMAEVFERNLRIFCDVSGYDVSYADVLPRDMRKYGGRDVRGITEFMNSTMKTHVVHIGGQTGGCTLASALRMINADKNLPILKTSSWKRFSKNSNIIAYIVNKSLFNNPGSFVANTIGGISNASDKILADFDFVSTRDFQNKKYPHAPDSVISIRAILEDKINTHEPKFSNYVAVQFRDGCNVIEITRQLVMLIRETNYDIVFFRAGAAVGHDSLLPYQTVLENMKIQGFSDNVHIFSSLDIWDISSLIANSELCIGTSLHVRIIAFAFSVPRVTFNPVNKQTSMIAHWDFGAMTCHIGAASEDGIFQTVQATMACGEYMNEAHSAKAVAMYNDMFRDMIAAMKICPDRVN